MTRKSHTLRLTEQPNHTGGIRVEFECPTGCVRGYVFSREAGHDEAVRAVVKAGAAAHAIDPQPERTAT